MESNPVAAVIAAMLFGGTLTAAAQATGPAGPAGPTGPSGATGAAGAKGDPGPTGIINHAEVYWLDGTTGGTSWTTINQSLIQAKTSGGPLMVWMNLFVNGPSYETCQPIVDGVWMGQFSAQPNSGDPFWKEGLVYTGAGGWHGITRTKLYKQIPAGPHNFAIQCATNSGTAGYCNSSNVGCSWGFTELSQ